MDYIPVYEGDDSDDGSVKLSPGKIQRTGVKSEPAAKRVIRTVVRAPGTIELDERRISVIAMRSESFVLKVADVTTGSHVVKGQPLMEVYSPAVSSAAAEYLATISSKTTGRRRLRPRIAAAADEPRRAGCGDRGHREEPDRSDLDRVDRAARRNRAGAQRDRGHARPARRRPVPDRRPFGGVGADRRRRTRSRRDRQGPAGHRAGAELSRTRVLREGRA